MAAIKPREEAGGDERKYLRNQAAEASAAMSKTAKALAGSMKDGVDVRLWTKEYPWIAVGTAAVAGFVAATLLVPSHEQEVMRQLEKIRKAAAPKPEPESGAKENGHGEAKSAGLFGMILREVFGMIRPLLSSLIAQGLASARGPETDEPTQDAGDQANSGPPDVDSGTSGRPTA